MLASRWRKVLMDLWSNKARSVLVVLSITVGVFSVGMVAGIYAIIKQDVPADYRATNPRDAVLYTDLFDENLLATARHVPGVGQVEGRSTISGQALLTGGKEVLITLEGVPKELGLIKINQLRLEQGAPVLHDHEIYIERKSLDMLQVKIGDTVKIKLAGDLVRELRVAGIVHDPNAASFTFAQSLFGYVNLNTLMWLGGTDKYSRMYLTTAVKDYDVTRIREVSNRLADFVSKSGRQVYATVIGQPGQHPAQQIVDAVIMLNAGLGILALLLSSFLVINTITALLSQQIRQIGIMKALGADMWQVMALYLVLILLFSLISLAIAIPLAGLAAYVTASFIASMINVNLAGFRITSLAVILQVFVGLFVPLLASLAPVFNGARVTVRELISNYGLGTGGARSLFDTILETVQGLPRPLLISLRNTFRRKGRLALTLSTLVLGGAIFIAVLNVQQAMYAALDVTFGYMLADVNVDFGRSYRTERIQSALDGVVDVNYWEGWGGLNTQVIQPDGVTSNDIIIIAPPAKSTLIKPEMTAGRWLVPEDQNAVVVGNHYLKVRPETKLGDTIQIHLEDKDYPFTVVGIYKMAGNATIPMLYANREYLEKALNQAGQVSSIRIQIKNGTFSHQKEVAEELKVRLKNWACRSAVSSPGAKIFNRNVRSLIS